MHAADWSHRDGALHPVAAVYCLRVALGQDEFSAATCRTFLSLACSCNVSSADGELSPVGR